MCCCSYVSDLILLDANSSLPPLYLAYHGPSSLKLPDPKLTENEDHKIWIKKTNLSAQLLLVLIVSFPCGDELFQNNLPPWPLPVILLQPSDPFGVNKILFDDQ